MTTPSVCLDGTWMDLLDVEFPANITDTENVPSGVTDLEWLKDELEAADLDDNGESYLAFLEQIDCTTDYQTVIDSYTGTYTDVTDFARERVEGEIPDYLDYYFDYEAFADDLENDYHFVTLPNGDTAIFYL